VPRKFRDGYSKVLYLCMYKPIAMPTFITSIKLLAASEADVANLNEAMKQKSFLPKDYLVPHSHKNAIEYVSNAKSNLLDATTDVSMAASSVGKKFSFTIMKDKSRGES
jgi:hypothetical protein